MTQALNLAQFIAGRQTFGSEESPDAFHIAFGVDANFVPPMGIMLTSLVINNPNRAFTVHVFLNSIMPEDSARLKKFAQQYPQIRFELSFVNAKAFAGFHVGKNYTSATYNRIIIADCLYPAVERLLYVDADTLCLAKLDDITDIPFDGAIFMSVPDKGNWLAGHKHSIGIADDAPYFNVGVMYIDLKAWNDFELSQKMMTLLLERKLPLQDQDALNLLLPIGGIKALPEKYNHFCLMKESNEILPSDTVIAHFAGDVKPWQPWCVNDGRKIYDSYRNRSLWKDFVYRPRNYQENRVMGKAMRRVGKKREALVFYWRYVREKLRQKMRSDTP